jgi:Zn-finger nucleic acid-binding protein
MANRNLFIAKTIPMRNPSLRRNPMKCPVCKVPTYAVEHDQIELDLCPDCQGIWFDAGELELLLEQGEKATLTTAEASDEKPRPCPLCSKKMNKVNIGPSQRVLIDTCPTGCGVWFDDNELQELTRDLAEDGWQVQPRIRTFLSEMFPTKGAE